MIVASLGGVDNRFFVSPRVIRKEHHYLGSFEVFVRAEHRGIKKTKEKKQGKKEKEGIQY